MTNPVLVEVTRGPIVESRHRAAAVVTLASGEAVFHLGDTDAVVYPRSAVKPFQALALIAARGHERFGLDDAEISLICASHGGEERHVAGVRSILEKIGFGEDALECGVHWPWNAKAAGKLGASGASPSAVHHNCSGKHAGMLALARILDAEPAGYTNRDHPVQRRIARVIEAVCGTPLGDAPCAADGCSVPTWAFPLKALARGFARFATGEGLALDLASGAERIRQAVAAEPFMIAGTGRFCTQVMEHTGMRALVKTGAEGVMCGAIPERGLGIAVKCDDGASRCADLVMAHLLAAFGAADADDASFAKLMTREIRTRNGAVTGAIRAAPALTDALPGGRGSMIA